MQALDVEPGERKGAVVADHQIAKSQPRSIVLSRASVWPPWYAGEWYGGIAIGSDAVTSDSVRSGVCEGWVQARSVSLVRCCRPRRGRA